MFGMRGIDLSVNEKERKERGLSVLRWFQVIYIWFQCFGLQLEDFIFFIIGIDLVFVVFIVLFVDSLIFFFFYIICVMVIIIVFYQ